MRQMFGRWRKTKEEAGLTCPLCGEVSPEETVECPKCYHQLGKSLLEQNDGVGEEVSSSLFDELLSDDEDDGEDEVVDWSKHTFEIDDVTIDVSQYEEGSESVALSAAPNFAAIEDDTPTAARQRKENLDDGEYELTIKDAPKDVEKFVVPDSKPVEEIEEPTHRVELVVPLLPKGGATQSDDEGPLADPSSVDDDMESTSGPSQTNQVKATTPTEPVKSEVLARPVEVSTPPNVVKAAVVTPVLPPTPTPALPATPSASPPAASPPIQSAPPTLPTPSVPRLPGQPAAGQENGSVTIPALPTPPNLTGSNQATTPPTSPQLPPTPKTPALPSPSQAPPANAFNQDSEIDVDAPTPSSLPIPVIDQMWPWPQKEAYDDLQVRRELRQVMESVKAGNLDEAARNLDKLGPHLGERREILFHVGVVLKKLGREQALRKMLESARRLHPEDQHVATALTSLGM